MVALIFIINVVYLIIILIMIFVFLINFNVWVLKQFLFRMVRAPLRKPSPSLVSRFQHKYPDYHLWEKTAALDIPARGCLLGSEPARGAARPRTLPAADGVD